MQYFKVYLYLYFHLELGSICNLAWPIWGSQQNWRPFWAKNRWHQGGTPPKCIFPIFLLDNLTKLRRHMWMHLWPSGFQFENFEGNTFSNFNNYFRPIALNSILREIHFENVWILSGLSAFILDPPCKSLLCQIIPLSCKCINFTFINEFKF